MFKVTKHIDFCYGHRLLNYDGQCRHLHGHNGRVEVDIESEKLDERGMVHDFSDIKVPPDLSDDTTAPDLHSAFHDCIPKVVLLIFTKWIFLTDHCKGYSDKADGSSGSSYRHSKSRRSA